jgi:broad specificity phosphatase PhoE
MPAVHFITHPEVVIDPAVPVPDWGLSPLGQARLRACRDAPWTRGIGAVFASTERKAREAAAILAEPRGLAVGIHAGLGENDRSATGYLPKAEFEAVADQFFAHPTTSIRGWERAVDAQARIVAAVEDILRGAPPLCDLALVAHGGVGALLLAHLSGRPISRALDQPGGGGGNRFVFDAASLRVLRNWQPIEFFGG